MRGEGTGVVLRVVRRRQDELEALQEGEDRRGLGQVRPLVELVGQEQPGHQGAQERREEDAPRLRGAGREPDGQAEDRETHQAAVAVGLGEVVPGDGQRVLMVLPERPEHRLADDRQVRRPPGIRGPVRQARDEVRGQVGQEHRGEHQPGSPGQVGQQAQGEPAGQGGPGEEAGPVEPADGPVALGGLSAGTLVLAARHLDSSRLDLTRRPDEREAYRSGPSRVCPCTGGASPRIRPGWV